MAGKPSLLKLAVVFALVALAGCASRRDYYPPPAWATANDGNTSLCSGPGQWLQNAALHDWDFRHQGF
jgi:hypothetical protein